MVELSKTFTFDAAHYLSKAGSEHKCSKMHGHTWKVEIVVAGEIDSEKGWFMDYAEISKAWQPLQELLDHSVLNEIEGLSNPTSERLAMWLWEKLKDKLNGLSAISVYETPTAKCTYRGK